MARVLIERAAALATAAGTVGLPAFAALRLSGRTVRWSSEAVAFTPLLAAGGGVLSTVGALHGHRRAAAVLAASAAALAAVVAPRARARPQPVASASGGQRLTILSANCYEGRADPQVLVALVRAVRPDVLALQEQNRVFIRKLEAAGLFELLPHRVLAAGGRLADAGLASVHPLEPTCAELSSEFVAAIVTLPSGVELPVISVHPIPPVGRFRTQQWIQAMAQVPEATGAFATGIVAGDFNATHDHPEFRAVLAKGWRDVAAELGAGLRSTWSRHGLFRLTIDHILVPPSAKVVAYDVHHLTGSDHRAISAVVALPI